MPEFLSPDSAQFKYGELCRVLGVRLREFGFKGTRGKWHRDFEESVQFCNVRKTRHSSSEKFVFAVNLCVFNRALGKFYWAPWQEGHELGCCHWRDRPDALAFDNGGDLIELTGSTDVIRMATEQFDLIRNFGLPAMDRVRTNVGAIQDLMSERPRGWMTNRKPEWLSVLAAVEGRADALQWAKVRLLEMTKHPASWNPTMAQVRWHFQRLARFVNDSSVELGEEGSGTVST